MTDPEPTPVLSPAPATRLMVILFTDLVDSSALKVRLGDHDYVQYIARPHNGIFRELLRLFPGAAERGYTGDGFMATFASVADAVTFALRFIAGLRGQPWERVVPQTRVGIHIGDTIEFGGSDSHETSLASHAADMTARVMSLAEGGQILMTRAAFDSARQSVRAVPEAGGATHELEWLAHGQYSFKGRPDPMEIFEVGVKGLAPLRPPGNSEKAKRIVTDEQALTLGWRPAVDLEIPTRPGWVVVQKLGEGGFGEVWLAKQARTQEVRAFKFCFDPDKLRAFKRELTFFKIIRKELGDRDDIARLLEVQVDKAPYYLESEYVSGGNLKDWAARRGGIEKVPLAVRLEFLATIAHAVASAHSLGIIHKDLKPSNVLIAEAADGTPHPRLADFGIGVLVDLNLLDRDGLEPTGFTETIIVGNDSSRTGTRMYSPPEALTGGAPNTAWDVYALGVMLYQLVIGDLHRPLGMGWEEHVTDELLRADIRDCVNGDPARRLASADLLQQRLLTLEERRHDLAASREREAAQERRRRRNRDMALASGVVIALLLTGIVTAALYIGRLKSANLEIVKQRNDAEAFSAAARKTVDEFLTDISRDELAIIPGFQETRRKFAEQAVAQYEEFTARRPNDAEIRFGLAKAKDALGLVTGSIGSLDEAVKELEAAVSLHEKNVKEFPKKPEYRLGLDTARGDLANLYWEVDQPLDAQPLIDPAIKDLEELQAEGFNDPEVKFQLAKAYLRRGNIGRDTGMKESNLNKADYDESATLFRQTLQAGYRKQDSLNGVSAAKHDLSLIAKSEGNFQRSSQLLTEADDLEAQALQLAPDSPGLLSDRSISLWNRALLLEAMKQPMDALNMSSNAVHNQREVVKANPTVTGYRQMLASILQNYARVLSANGYFRLSHSNYIESCQILEKLSRQADDRPAYAEKLIEGQLKLAEFLQGAESLDKKRDDAAYGESLDLAMATARTFVTKYPKATGVWFQRCCTLSQRAYFDQELKQDERALELLREYRQDFVEHVWLNGGNHDAYQIGEFLKSQDNASDIAYSLNQTNEAFTIAEVAWKVGRDSTNTGPIQCLATILNRKASILTKAGRYPEAIETREQSLKISRPAWERATWHWYLRQDVGGDYMHLSELYQKVGDLPKEVRARQEYLRIMGRPLFGMDTTGFLDPDPAPSKAEAQRLRDTMAVHHDIIRFSVSATFNGKNYPFFVYITDVPAGTDPLADQARWLEEERGGTIDEEVRAKFRRLHDLAHSNHVSFCELCDHALSDKTNEVEKAAAPENKK